MKQDWLALARQVLDIEIQGIQEVRESLGQEFVQALKALAACTGRVVVTGLGKSGLVGRKIAATLSSTGTPAYFLHPVEGIHGDLGMIREGDVVLALSNSGETDELNTILPTLQSLGSKIISLTGNTSSTMAGLSDITICTGVSREACTLGLAPTASTTATLAVGDALAVGLIEWHSFGKDDFRKYHPGGELGRRLSLTIDELMHTGNFPSVESGCSLKAALEVLDQGGLGTVVVLSRRQKLVGILTDGDVRRLVCHRQFSMQDQVDEYMTKRPRYVCLGQRCAKVLDEMEKSAITVMPVVDQGLYLKGLVHLHDLLGKGHLRFNDNN